MTTEIKYHTKEEALTAITKDGYDLEFCTSEIKHNEEIVLIALKQDSWNFKYASDELKSNKDFIMKAIHEGIDPWYLIFYSNKKIKSDIEIMTLVVEKSTDGMDFSLAKGETALNKELAAKALVKWGKLHSYENFELWECLDPTLQEFFPQDSWYHKSLSYLLPIERAKQNAKNISGGTTEEDGVVW